MDYDTEFNTSGVFPTDPDFWQPNADKFVSETGITPDFSKVLGEQVFKPLGTFETPFYNEFAGRPLYYGAAWMERAVFKNEAMKFKPKATANDDLSFKDSSGIEITYKMDVAGWVKATIPTDLETIQMFLTTGQVGQLNSILVENVLRTYQMAIESEIGKKLVSNIKDDVEIDFTDGTQAVKDINKYALRMKGNTYHYNMLTAAQNSKLITRSREVLCFIDAETLEMMRDDFATLPSPDRISENVRFIPMYDGLPTPVTTAEFGTTYTDGAGSTITWTGDPPVAVDEDKPLAILVSRDICEYRPLVNGYRINLTKNGAGDFQNEHLIYMEKVFIKIILGIAAFIGYFFQDKKVAWVSVRGKMRLE